MPVSIFTVIGTFTNANNTPAKGSVTFFANNDWDINTGVIEDNAPVIVTLNDLGTLPHTDLLCNVGGYHVLVKIGPPGNTVEFDMPSQTPFSVVDLASFDAETSTFHSADIGAAAVPKGGTVGQVLTKLSSTNYDDGWADATGGGGGAVSSVNGHTGTVVLAAADVSADVSGAAATAQAAAIAASQPLDGDLTAIAALTTTSFGRALLALADAAALRTAAALGTAATSDTSAFDAAGAASTAQAAAIAASQPVDADLTAIAALTTTTFGRSFLALADAAAGRTLLGLGTAATSATSAFDPAGAAAAAQAASQPLDSDLTTLAGLTATTDSIIQSKASAWSARTPAQFKTDLVLVKADVGLGSVDNTADTAKPVSTAQQTALDLKANLASPTFSGTVTLPAGTVTLAQHANLAANSIQGNNTGSPAAPLALTVAQVKTLLNYVAADIPTLAPLASPTFTGTVVVPAGTITLAQQVNAAANSIRGNNAGSPATPLDLTVAQTKTLLNYVAADIPTLAPLASPTFTGTTTIPTTGLALGGVTSAALGEANLGLATLTNHGVLLAAGAGAFTALALDASTTKYLKSGGSSAGPSWATINVTDIPTAAPLASPTFTGTVTIPGGASISGFATLASPTFTGTATMPLVRFTAGSYTASLIDVQNNVANTFATTASMSHRGINISPTDTWSVASDVALMFLGFNSAGVFVNDSASAIDLGPVVSFQANYIKKIDTQTGRSMGAFDTDFNSAPLYQAANSGTFTSAAHTSFAATGTLNAVGCTMTSHKGLSSAFTVTNGTLTTLTHISLADPTGAGTITTQVGIDIAAFAKGGTNIGIRNKANTQLGSSAQLTVDTSGNLSTSGNLATSGSGTLTVAGNIGFNGKTAQATTGWSAPTATLDRTAVVNPTYTTTGGTGATAGAFDTAAHRDNIITGLFLVTKQLAALVTDLRANGVIA